MTVKQINIANDFTPFPGGRYRKNGRGSGEEFRQRFLEPLFNEDAEAIIELDGASGYPPSFLEEAFGGLVRQGHSVDEIRRRVSLKARDAAFEAYRHLAWQYVERAAQKHSVR